MQKIKNAIQFVVFDVVIVINIIKINIVYIYFTLTNKNAISSNSMSTSYNIKKNIKFKYLAI